MRLKLFEKSNKLAGSIDQKENIPLPNGEIKFSRLGGDSDFNLMIAKNQEEIQRRLSDENQELKECLKQLQRELFDIVDMKTEIYLKRFRAEQNGADYDNEEVVRHEIERIREELFNLPFQESGRELVNKFQVNFSKLKEFMERLDKDLSNLPIFNEKDIPSLLPDDKNNQKFASITSVQ